MTLVKALEVTFNLSHKGLDKSRTSNINAFEH